MLLFLLFLEHQIHAAQEFRWRDAEGELEGADVSRRILEAAHGDNVLSREV